MKNKCELIQDLIPLYSDGCASGTTREEVEEHLDSCCECRAYAASYRRASRISAHTELDTHEHTFDIDLPYASLAQRIRIRRRINTACMIGGIIAGAMAMTFLIDRHNKK